MNLILRILAVLLFGAFFAGTVLAADDRPARTLDEMVERLESIFAGGGEFEGFASLVDPSGQMRTGLIGMAKIISDQAEGRPLGTTEMFRTQSVPNGAKLVLALTTEDGKTALFLGLVVLRGDDGWRTVYISGQGRFEQLDPLFH